jgi:predicted amidohydrolase YtcJ
VAAALDAFERTSAPPGQRLEHAPLLPPALVERVARAGAYVVGQPGLLAEVAPRYERLIGPQRRAALQPWRSLLDAGARIAFSSDAPVSRSGPLAASAAASSERPDALAAEQAIEPLEALRAWTAGAAEACGLAERGRIAVGAPADLVAVAGPFARDLAACRVLLTMIGGAIAFREDALV